VHYYFILISQYSNSISIFGVVLTYGNKPIFEIKKLKIKIKILEQPPPPLKITFYMGIQNHAGRLLETEVGSEAS
jgi:hypothetical protein